MVSAHGLLSENRSKSSVCGRARSSLGDGRHELPRDNRVGSPGRGEAGCEEEPKTGSSVHWWHGVRFSASAVN